MVTRIKSFIWKLDAVLRDLIIGIGFYFVLISLLELFIVKDKTGFILGTLLGCVVAAGLSVHMYSSLDRGLDMDSDSAQKYIFSRSMLRLFMMLVVLFLGAVIPGLSVIGVAFGLLGLKVSALMQPLVSAYITKKIFREGE